AESDVAADIQKAMAVKPAAKLNMIDKFPNDFFDDVSPTANYYNQVLSTLQAMIRGETDMAFVEEMLRRYYLHVGWQLYSVDKLLSSLARFAISIKSGESKDKTWDIWMHFRKDRVRPETTYEDELSYRKRVEKDIKDGEMYRITYVSLPAAPTASDKPLTRTLQDQTTRKIYIRILQRDDPTFNLSELDEIQLWATYVNSFTSVAPTEGVPFDRVRVPFLRRSAPEADDLDEAMDELRAAEKLAARISPDTYKPSFTPDLADWVVHAKPALSTAEDNQQEAEAAAAAPATEEGADATATATTTAKTPAAAQKEAAELIRAQSDEREDRVAEKLLANSPWMRGMSEADVQAATKQYADIKDGAAAEGAGEGMDVDEGVKA
ncbi:MAG: hypothetical protein INR71_04590, partial [Terriglobus roseus]|nr:hypothetical protein [Terriglobus roseus]